MKQTFKLALLLFIFPIFSSVEAQENKKLNHIGEFSREGEYIKDYYVYKEGDTFHLFYNVGNASLITQEWTRPENEKAFGHATSKDLNNWQHHPRILHVVPKSWEGQVVSAPSILKYKGVYYMVYTGFDDRVFGKQTIGLATSKDLYNWERYEKNPINVAPDWVIKKPNGWVDFRDAHIIRYKNEFLMFTMATTTKGEGAIALSVSKDLKTWTDKGPALITFNQPESPRVFKHKRTYYMFASSSHGKVLYKTKKPTLNNWTQVAFDWPSGGIWSGWEVTELKGKTIFSAFLWKKNGNFIRFWDIEWKGETPVVKY
jgi:sucrose-6-phosphate hydrolase SacC (GH32 family)